MRGCCGCWRQGSWCCWVSAPYTGWGLLKRGLSVHSCITLGSGWWL